MTLGDKVFGGGGLSPSIKYTATWLAMTLSLFIAVAAWSADEIGSAGQWGISLLGLAMLTFAAWGNRYFRKRVAAARSQSTDAGRTRGGIT